MSKVIKKPQHRSYTTQPYPPIAMPATAPTSQAPSQTHSQAVSPVNTTDRTSAPWAAEDDKILMEARAQGQNWAPIAELHFPRKTPNACRKRHERLMEKRNADSWDGTVKVEDLARAYMDCRKEMWKILAEKVNEKWELVEIKVCLTLHGCYRIHIRCCSAPRPVRIVSGYILCLHRVCIYPCVCSESRIFYLWCIT